MKQPELKTGQFRRKNVLTISDLSKLYENQRGYMAIIFGLMVLIFIFVLFPFKIIQPPLTPAQQNTLNLTNAGCQLVTSPNPPTVTTKGGEIAKLALTNVFIHTGNLAGRAQQLVDTSNNGEVLSTDGSKYVRDGNSYLIYYPSGHLQIHAPGLGKGSNYHVKKLGFIFLAKLNSNGELITHTIDTKDPVRVRGMSKGKYVLTDIFQLASVPIPIPPELIASCQGNNAITLTPGTTPSKPKIVIPPQKESSDKNQLQLQWFVFESSGGAQAVAAGFWSLHCKPAIYLNPTKPTQFNVKVNTKGFLTYTDPVYPAGGWQGTAFPDGKIEVSGKNYPYLYYESKIPDSLIDIPPGGLVSEYQKLSDAFDYLLPKLGLDQKQILDFKDYWQKALPYSPYYQVGVMEQSEIDKLEPLDIYPKPDTSIRVRLYFKALDQKPDLIKLPEITTPVRIGYTMVEWGGMIKLDKNHPFTCSQ